MTISRDTIIRRVEGPISTRVGDEIFAMDAQRGFLFGLNESASMIWDLVETPAAVRQVCEQLRCRFSVDEETCHRDVVTVLEELMNAGLVEEADAASASRG